MKSKSEEEPAPDGAGKTGQSAEMEIMAGLKDAYALLPTPPAAAGDGHSTGANVISKSELTQPQQAGETRTNACYARAGMMLANQVDELDKECRALEAEAAGLRGLLSNVREALQIALPPPEQWDADNNPNASAWEIRHGDVIRLSDSFVAIDRHLSKSTGGKEPSDE
jgi:hypothetical protein